MSVTKIRDGARADFSVVGAGPAGSHIASVLAKAGFRVVMFEKKGRGREKPCGGLINPKTWRMIGSARSGLEYWPLYGTMVFSTGKRHIYFRGKRPKAYALFRSEFDTLLSDIAGSEGVKLFECARVSNVRFDSGSARVALDRSDPVSCDAVIGADGTFSTVARASGLRTRSCTDELVFCLSSEFEVGQNRLEDMLFDINTSEIFIMGGLSYGWIIPKGDHVNVGCGRSFTDLTTPFELWEQFLKVIRHHGRFAGHDIPRPRGYSYRCLRGPVNRTYGHRTILLGDAAGLANNLNGEGIWPAIRSGDLALPVLERAYRENDFSEHGLSEYERSWKREWGSKYERTYLFLRLLSRLGRVHRRVVEGVYGERSGNEASTFDRILQLLKKRKDVYSLVSDLILHRRRSELVIPEIVKKAPGIARDYFELMFQSLGEGKSY